MKTQVVRTDDGRQYGRDGNKDYNGWIVYIWQDREPVEFRNAIKVAEGLWVARL